MDWILDHFQIVVVIGVIVASLVKRVLEGKNAEPQAPDGGDVFEPGEWKTVPPRPSVPPPLARQSPPATRRAVPPPRVERNDEAELLKRQQDMQERLRRIKETRPVAVSAVPQRKPASAKPAQAGLRGALREPREIRRAIVMREILGPPVGLR